MAGRFRHRAPVPRAGWVQRGRIVDRLQRRFEVAVTLVVAPAGYGKTAALAQAAAETAADPTRLDVWLRCSPTDSSPDQLAASLSASIEAVVDRPLREPAANLPALAELLTSLAPAEVCLILDDVHVVTEHAALDELLSALPANAHVVLAGRTMPPVDLVRHELAGNVIQLTSADLAFDDAELAELLGDRRIEIDPATRWPAIVALELGSGAIGPIDFLLAEVAYGLGDERRSAVFALAHLDEIDDAAALAATRDRLAAEELLADLPLVHRSRTGTFRLHELWRESAASPSALSDDVADALRRVAAQRLVTNPVEAARLFSTAQSPEGVERALLEASKRTPVAATVDDLRELDPLAAGLGDRPVARLVAASVLRAGDELTSAERFAEAGAFARRAGDHAVEAVALLNELIMRWAIDPATLPAEMASRAEALDERTAGIVGATVGAFAALQRGAPDDALRSIERLTPPSTEYEAVCHAFGLLDIGRPELVTMSERSGTPASKVGGQHVALAIWLTGSIEPAAALAIGRELAAVSDERQMPLIQVSTNAVLAFMAVAAGEAKVAREHADRAVRRAAHTASVTARAFARLADAVVAIDEHGDDEAARRLERLLDDVPIGAWPRRPYLGALASIYVLAPSSRATLDRINVGPALTTAIAAGRALVDLRERQDLTAALSLPWRDALVLRAHVVPSHLVELAAAAAAMGSDEAALVLGEVPETRRRLADVARRCDHQRVAAWANARIRELPPRPPYELQLDLLGTMSLRRDGAEVVDPDWSSRVRVRQLLAYVVHHRRAMRRRIVDDLWPDLEPAKALQNLRVNLAHLQRVLQPDRERSDPPWFVRSTEQAITAVTDGLTIDVDRLHELHRQARRLDDAGRSTEASEMYRTVLALDRGEYLEEFPDAAWAEMERARISASMLAARCRLGELVLARGEPEESVAHATTALLVEPLHERAVRLLANGLSAQGDRAAARRAMQHALGRLADHRLQPEPATLRIAERLGLAP